MNNSRSAIAQSRHETGKKPMWVGKNDNVACSTRHAGMFLDQRKKRTTKSLADQTFHLDMFLISCSSYFAVKVQPSCSCDSE